MIAEILKDTTVELKLFRSEEVDWLEKRIVAKETKNGIGYFADCQC